MSQHVAARFSDFSPQKAQNYGWKLTLAPLIKMRFLRSSKHVILLEATHFKRAYRCMVRSHIRAMKQETFLGGSSSLSKVFAIDLFYMGCHT